MKKISIIFLLLGLIISNSFVTNSTKKIDENIIYIKENLSLLNDKNELLKLEYDYLSSPAKLEEYQVTHFEENLVIMEAEDIHEIFIKNNNIEFIQRKWNMTKNKETKLILENYPRDFKYNNNKNVNFSFNRVAFIFFTFVIIFLIFSLKIVYIGYDTLNEKKFIISDNNFRSTILDRNNVILSKSIITRNIGINPREVIDSKRLILNLKLIFPDKNFNKIKEKLNGNKFFYLEKKISKEKYNQLFLLGDKSIKEEANLSRIYPQKSLFSHILGQIDDDNNGISGVEKFFDYELKKSKKPLILSLDTNIQYLIREELIKAKKIFNNIGSAAILMNVNNGEIVSLVSLPDYDLNKRQNLNDLKYINRATKAVYELGSVFKTFTFTAGLNEDVIDKDTNFLNLDKTIKCGKNLIREYDDKIPQNITAEEILIRSGNIGSVRIGQKIGINKYKSFLNDLGLIEKIQFDIQEIGQPIPFNWGKCKLATSSFGHGITTTLLQLAKAYAIISNGGYQINPTLIKTNNFVKEKNNKILKEGVSEYVNSVLRKVVSSKNGTAGFANVPGYEVGGKTGTAQKIKNGKYSQNKVNTFVSIFPVSNPKFVLLVLLDEPKANKDYIYNYRDGSDFKYKGNWRNTAGWTSVEIAGKIIENIGPILATKY